MAIALTIGAVLLLVFDHRERKRAVEPRYFSAEDGHPITICFERRFAFVQPRAWCALALVFSLITAIVAVMRP